MKKLLGLGVVTLVAAIGAGCSVEDTRIPDLAGPSELGLRVSLQAVPDSILQDGFSQAALQIEATTADGRAARNLTLRIQSFVDGTAVDLGTLSAKTVVTGDDGRARVTYTAPPRPAQPVETFTVVTFSVEPVGSDYRGTVPRTVDLRLVVPGVIQPPPPRVDPPQPQFSVSGNTGVLTNVVFDASGTLYDRGADQDPAPDFAPCGALCTYSWDFGDGTTGSGIFVTHQYSRVGNYQVRLTVTDPYGQTASTAQTINVGAGGQPTATFTFSPTAPSVNQQVFFSAEASRAAPGRQIVSYDWNFGSGRTGSGVTIRQTFGAVGTYNVTLTVTDDAGNQATATQAVNVSLVGTLQAVLQVSPTTGGTTNTTFQFDGAQSTPGAAPIVEYRFNFGDNTEDVVTTIPVTTHRFTAAGSYQVSLQVKDSQGRTSIARLGLTVAAPTPGAGGTGAPTASFTVDAITGPLSKTFSFNGSGSVAGASPIVSYTWNFGDGGGPQVLTATPTYKFQTSGEKLVTLTVRASDGLEGSTSLKITVTP